ncbi:hypothetical protein R1sor_026648 [Riccia sorocarpa]|uniref:Ubiquitin-like protease family profile domain-containing protein n=1 Tax=Riccia sorocarpa TaxID=122646 RepID=A0ABD3GF49_9MARC
MLEFDPVAIGRLAVDDIMDSGMQTSPDASRPEYSTSFRVPASSANSGQQEAPKAEVRKSFLHYASLELHGVKVDWSTVDLSQATNTVSYERKMAARLELFRMRVRMDGRLVETMDPDEMNNAPTSIRILLLSMALPDATYKFFCTIFVPQCNDSIDPNTGEIVTMEENVEREELVGRRGRHVTRNEVDVVSTGEHKRFAFIEVNMALKLWVAENAIHDFSVDKLLGPQELQAPSARRDIDGADFEDDLSKRERIILQSDITAMRDVLPPVTRSARTRLDYETLAAPSYVPRPAAVEEVIIIGEDPSAGAPAEKDVIMDLVIHTGDSSTDAPTRCIAPMIADVVNLVEDDGMKSPLSCTILLEMHPDDTLIEMRPEDTLMEMRPNDTLMEMRPKDTCLEMRPEDTLMKMRPKDTLMEMRPDDTQSDQYSPELCNFLSVDPFTFIQKPILMYSTSPTQLMMSNSSSEQLTKFTLLDPSFNPKPVHDTTPPPSQMIPVRDTELVDLSEYMDSPEENRRLRKGWPTRLSLTKVDIQSGCLPKQYMRWDVINCYINERFLAKPRDQLHNMFYVNTFWFTLASNLVHNYEKSNFSLEKLKPITRLRNSISPDLRDVDLLTGSPAWIFIPVHGKYHWSLAIIRLIGNECRLCHLDSHLGIHKKSKIFHVLKTFLAHTMPIDMNQIMEDSFEVDEQKDEYTCGFHVLQMLAGAGTKELALDRCYMVERLGSIDTLDQVTSFELVFASYLSGRMKGVPI